MAADAVAEIKGRLDIVDVIGGYMSLTRAGRSFKGLCPFHSEKSPSFNVNQERQAWYCFGCSEGGDLFTFVEKIEHLDFRGALQLLADRAGVELEEKGAAGKGAARRRRRATEMNQRAQAFFEHVLWQTESGADGRRLLETRGIPEELARQFGIGFAPAGGASQDALVRFLLSRVENATVDEIVDAGLAHHSRRGGGRDRFRHRLTFPIRDDRGEVIAFGARALGDDHPKYLNSPETALYHKSRALFGIDLAREAMRTSGSVLIVEGYFDVIAAHRAGIAAVVASSGTALTSEQVKILARTASSVTLCFDADDAGRAAADRAVDLVAAEGLAARIVELPDGVKDPDELVAREPAAFKLAVDHARPEWQVLLDRAVGSLEGGSVEARRLAAERTAGLLARIPEAATRDLYLQQAAARLELSSPAALAADVARAARQPARQRVVASAPVLPAQPRPVETEPGHGLATEPGGNHLSAWEQFIATAVVQRPAVAQQLLSEHGLGLTELISPHARHIIEVALETPGSEFPLSRLSGTEQALAARLLLASLPELEDDARPEPLARALAECVAEVREAAARAELGAIQRELRRAKDEGRVADEERLAERMVEIISATPRLQRRRKTSPN